MDIKEAVKLAATHIGQLFESDGITNVGLEEVEYDEFASEWIVTVGFSRPWDYPKVGVIGASLNPGVPKRSYKVVRIKNTSGDIASVKNRDV